MTLREFFETQPLYAKTDIAIPTYVPDLFPEPLFLYCEICNAERPFRYPHPRGSGAGSSPKEVKHGEIYGLQYTCTGCQKQEFICWFKISLTPQTSIQKVGQYPSVADLYSAKIKRYRKVLSPEDYRELNRAVGLAAHGVGIGAFVYLRRIFERLIEEAHQTASLDTIWDEERFLRSRVPEKITLLASYLPGFLVENKTLYGIISKGLHELSEEECIQYFSVIRLGIELILEERIAMKEKNEKIAQAKKDISMLTKQIGKKTD